MSSVQDTRVSTRRKIASQRAIESAENDKYCEGSDKSIMLVVTQYDDQKESTEIILSQLLTDLRNDDNATDYEAGTVEFNKEFNDGVDVKSTPSNTNKERERNAELRKEIEELKTQKELNSNCIECYQKVLENGHLKESQKRLSLEKSQKTKQIEELLEKLNKKECGKNTTNGEDKQLKDENKKMKLEIQKKNRDIESLKKLVEKQTEESVKMKEELIIAKINEQLLMEEKNKKKERR